VNKREERERGRNLSREALGEIPPPETPGKKPEHD